jgi:hypothetical protein
MRAGGRKTRENDPISAVLVLHPGGGYPVHFCEFQGGHMVPSFAAQGIWAFFDQF